MVKTGKSVMVLQVGSQDQQHQLGTWKKYKLSGHTPRLTESETLGAELSGKSLKPSMTLTYG